MKESSGHIAANRPRGSALILTVVLTSLLAIVGVLFVMGTRIDKMATTAATESRELTCAIDTVLTRLDQVLAEDVPGVTKNQEYYDYPDDLNPWLADLEPYESSGKHYWRQISNLDGILTTGTKSILIDKTIGERDAIVAKSAAADPDVLADADGDGVPDAKWFQVPGVMTSKGKRFYAAVRIIDNGGMLNLNTGLAFDPADSAGSAVDPTSPLRVNVLALAAALNAAPTPADEDVLLGTRANGATGSAAARDMATYERDVIWQYLDVRYPSVYTPFDMSDELELRYRYLLDQTEIDTRVEACGRFGGASVPVNRDLDKWYPRVTGGTDFATYAYRHVATTYNMDRIITPKPVSLDDGIKLRKMVNVNTTDKLTLWRAIAAALADSQPSLHPEIIQQDAAQITANLLDYIDDDDEVTVIQDLSSPYFGFERPCIYISEIACRLVEDQTGKHFSYGVELFKPYFEDKDPKPDEWLLKIDNPNIADTELSLVWSGSRRFHVVLGNDDAASLAGYVTFTDANEPADTMPLYAYNRADYAGQPQKVKSDSLKFEAGATISLFRVVPGVSRPAPVDMARVPEGFIPTADGAYSVRRDISPHRWVWRLWASGAQRSTPTLGNDVGPYVDSRQPGVIQAHPANKPLTNIGELGKVFRKNGYIIPEGALAGSVLIDLIDPNNAGLFKYLTVIDPSSMNPRLAGTETRIMGRININTAPAFVLAQLPWMSYRIPVSNGAAGGTAGTGSATSDPNASFKRQTALERGQEIIKYRDVHGPFQSTADLMRVNTLHELASDKAENGHNDVPRGPDLTPDTALDDFEERDLLFTRLSDLVTVRSDVFTAYLLVRIGEAGPQKRLIAIFDRSRVNSAGDKARLVALQPVPDPR